MVKIKTITTSSLRLLIVLGSIILFTNCDSPEAKFTYDSTYMDALTPIKFTNQSLNADTYEWDFGDGTYHSDVENPEHIYKKSGTYDVTLVASTDKNADYYQETLTINRPTVLHPGIGFLNYSIGESWSSVKTKIGEDHNIETSYHPDYGIYSIKVYNSSYNYYLTFYESNPILKSGSEVILMGVFNDFDGITALNIGLQNTTTDVLEAYGEPDQTDSRYEDLKSLDYYSKGITFGYEESDYKISKITIFPSQSSKSSFITNCQLW